MRRKNHMAPARIILIGFALLILAGALLLTLPISTRDGQGAAFFDALFTATSATCVTGLVVQDTALYWSGFGQAVILMLIQIGGMGVVTAAAAISMLAGRRIVLKERWVMQESISVPQVGGIVRRTRRGRGRCCWLCGSARRWGCSGDSGTRCFMRCPPSATPGST